MEALSPIEQVADAQDGQQAHWPWVPWAVSGGLAAVAFALLSMTGSLRNRAAELTQELTDAQAAYADLQTEQALLQQKLAKLETNSSRRIDDLQKQIVQKTQEFQRQKADLESRIETRGNEFAKAEKQLAVFRTRAAQDSLELEGLNETLSGVNSPNQSQLTQLRVGVMLPTADGPTNATGGAAYDLSRQQGVLTVEGLPPLPPDRDYQLWIVDANVLAPISGGVFRTNDRGATRTEFRATGVQSADRFAVSVERRGGTTIPQGRFVLASN